MALCVRDFKRSKESPDPKEGPKPLPNCLNHPQNNDQSFCWFHQLTDVEPTARSSQKIAEIAVIFVCISCWVSGQLRPFLEFTMVLIQRNNTGKSGTVTQPRISRKSKPGYEPGKRGSTLKSLILHCGGSKKVFP